MTRQQKWARDTHAIVCELARRNDEAAERKYATRCMQAPSLLQRAGLVQALVFWGKDDENKLFRNHVAKVLGATNATTGDALLKLALDVPADRYIVLSREVADVALWFRRFAQSELKHDDEGSS